MYIQRTLEPFLQKATQTFPVVLLTGPRQVGKTTLLRHLTKDRQYVTLDDPVIAALAQNEPALFLQRFSPPVLIDEIQYAPQLLPYIKMYVDMHPGYGHFWLTGSQQFTLMKGVSESLAGRVGIINTLGLSLMEQQQATGESPFLPHLEVLKERFKKVRTLPLLDLYRYIWRGSFPAIATNEAVDWELFYGSYVRTYLQRDVRDLANVGNELSFLKFLRATAARTGQLLNMADIARDAGVSSVTAKNWLLILQASGMIFLLEPYFTNMTKRIVKAPKLYFLDTGLCCYLTEWSTAETLEAGAMSGAILETFVVTEIIKSYWHNGEKAPIYYYRDKDKKEIDLLIVKNGIAYPIEIKKTSTPQKGDVRNFHLIENLKLIVGEGAIVCLINTLLPITPRITAIPAAIV